MSQVSTIIQAARNWTALQGNSKSKLARESGLHPNTLRNLDNEDFNCDLETLTAVEKYLTSKKILNQKADVKSSH